MRIFLTGGSGYIGQATIAELVRRGHVVEALARSEQSARTVAVAGAAALRGGLADLDVLNHAAARAEAVIHLAQAGSADMDLAAAAAMQDGIGAGTYVHTGGSWVYGDTHGVQDETAPWNPPSVVAWRRSVEDEVLARAGEGARPVIVQPGLLYGGDNRLIDHFIITPGKLNGAIPYIGDGANRWALIHVDDVATLYAAASWAGHRPTATRSPPSNAADPPINSVEEKLGIRRCRHRAAALTRSRPCYGAEIKNLPHSPI